MRTPGLTRLYREVESRNWDINNDNADVRLCIRMLDRNDYQSALTYYWHAIDALPPYGMPGEVSA